MVKNKKRTHHVTGTEPNQSQTPSPSRPEDMFISVDTSVSSTKFVQRIAVGHLRVNREISITLHKVLLVHPRASVLQELDLVNTSGCLVLGDPDGLAGQLVRLFDVVGEGADVGSSLRLPVNADEVDGAASALVEEVLEVAETLVVFPTVGDGGRANLDSLVGIGLDEFPVLGNGSADVHAGSTLFDGTVSSQFVFDDRFLMTYPQ